MVKRAALSLRTVLLIAMGLFWIPVAWAGLSDGLVAYYPFNGNANDRLGKADSAYQFDGINDYISIGNNPILHISNAVTLSAWVILNI